MFALYEGLHVLFIREDKYPRLKPVKETVS